MPIGYVPLQGAAEFGQGLGDALSRAFIQIPQQKREYALQQNAQLMEHQRLMQQQQMMQGMLGYRQGLLGIQQDRVNNQDMYNQGRLDLGQQGLDQRGANNEVVNGIRQLSAQAADTRANAYAESPRQNYMGLGGGAYVGPDTNGMQAVQQAPRQFAPLNANAADRNQLEWMKLYAGLAGATNPALQQLTGQVSNRVMNAQAPIQQGLQQQGLAQPQTQNTNRPPTLQEFMQNHGIQ